MLILLTFMFVTGTNSLTAQSAAQLPKQAARNVILVTLDGLRWQEVFSGADETLMNTESGGVKDLDSLKQRFLRESASERRQQLMPFFWSTVAEQGAIIGDPVHNSRAVVTNGLNFSYPGYSELLCGYADPAVDSNAKQNNVNVTVLEWLNQQPGFEGKVAAFCSWDVFPFIINKERSGIPVNAGWESLTNVLRVDDQSSTEIRLAAAQLQELEQLSEQVPRYWPELRYDYFTFKAAEISLQHNCPRVMYVSLGETDDWAHAGRYDLYLDAARRNDAYIAQLWQLVQSMPDYKDQTTLILTTDHGRGDNRIDWKSHGRDIADCQYIWMAAIGPGITGSVQTATSGELLEVTQSQIAATVAAAVGLDYCAAQPKAAAPLPIFGN